jgi:hypothetical protein
MSKGWESKSVEEQQAERAAPVDKRPKIDGPKERARQALELQREQILSARTANPHRRAALEAALAQVEGQIAALDASVA